MGEPTAVVLGGYGSFGRLVAASLCRHAGVRVIVAGRDRQRAEKLCRDLGCAAVAEQVDCHAPEFAQRIAALAPAVVIDAVGPFQSRDYSTALACVRAGSHYVDLADSRDYVMGIVALNDRCLERQVLAASGASTCPAMSTAVVDQVTVGLSSVESLSVGIAPGHRQPRGLATVRAVLSSCGHRMPAWREGRRAEVHGWSGLIRHRYGAPIGARWLSRVDLPELDLWPQRYPAVLDVETRGGLEISVLHLGLSLLSHLVRLRMIRSLTPHAELLSSVSNAFEPFGTPTGAMHVEIIGRTTDDRRLRRTWSILAERGDGPQIPAMPAALLAKRLLGLAGYAPLTARGAQPCAGLLRLPEMVAELAPYAIRTELIEETLAD
jgi:hypothetical protein